MRKSKYRKRHDNLVLVVALLLFISVGFALLNTNLNILGTTQVASTKWDVHWANLSVTEGSVTGSGVTTPASIKTGNTEVEFSITLNKPGEFYEFTVDAVNQGTLDAMIDSITNGVYESNGTTEKTLPAYLNYTVTYDDGIALAQHHKLLVSTTEKIKVRVEFKSDVTAEQLPQTAETTGFKFGVNYVQADSNATSIRFGDDDWSTIVSNVKSGNIPSYYTVGSTKEVDMGSFGTHTIRISNTTTPSECSTEGFSQTACGFVLEFADIISAHRMNPSDSEDTTTNGVNNKGGWEYSEMRTYVNNDIYNALPTDLKNGIINTVVVSSYGEYDTQNFVTNDKIYLLSVKELWDIEWSNYTVQTRQLDYYKSVGVKNTNNMQYVIKERDGSNFWWWLRTARSTLTTFHYVYFDGGWGDSPDSNYNCGVSPAFRIG